MVLNKQASNYYSHEPVNSLFSVTHSPQRQFLDTITTIHIVAELGYAGLG
jgi:hypothetical protein